MNEQLATVIRNIGKKDDARVVFGWKQGLDTDEGLVESRTARRMLYLTYIAQFRAQDRLVLGFETARGLIRARLHFIVMRAKQGLASSR
ncbi:hypothetical protein [Bradyrhizobium sp. Gha]|uniref:hypothetical protein n=1 Tax=Bradyrhizobium sp. Gha TaxID=1855318 RepID=UPI0015A583DB|nr:hypothetical protein [Bradyrhizobium sp. Gha]